MSNRTKITRKSEKGRSKITGKGKIIMMGDSKLILDESELVDPNLIMDKDATVVISNSKAYGVNIIQNSPGAKIINKTNDNIKYIKDLLKELTEGIGNLLQDKEFASNLNIHDISGLKESVKDINDEREKETLNKKTLKYAIFYVKKVITESGVAVTSNRLLELTNKILDYLF